MNRCLVLPNIVVLDPNHESPGPGWIPVTLFINKFIYFPATHLTRNSRVLLDGSGAETEHVKF